MVYPATNHSTEAEIGSVPSQSQGQPTSLDVDAFFGSRASLWDKNFVALTHSASTRGMVEDRSKIIPLGWDPSPFVDGLRVMGHQATTTQTLSDSNGVLVGTVRMGFGHHRIAYSAYTWALSQGHSAYMHDLLAIESPESEAIRKMDETYSRFSRLSADWGGVFEWMWGLIMKQGNLNSLRSFCRLAESVAPLMNDLPKDMPVIASHPLNGQIAVACGFEKVINLVIDNHPQHFVLVPGALNLVQGESYYAQLMQMGVPAEALAVAGHWVSHGLVTNAEKDCTNRIAWAEKKRPRRLLIPVGGAGAQRKYITSFVRELAPRLRNGDIRVFLNAGDHAHMRVALQGLLEELGLSYLHVQNAAELNHFCRSNALEINDPENATPVVLCSFDSHFEAFSATDHLMRVSDILATKPSELAFFPIPKLHIRRVGDHEAASALRAAELGDGTLEAREVADAMEWVRLFVDSDDLFIQMNQSIIKNTRAKIYHGSANAVERALS